MSHAVILVEIASQIVGGEDGGGIHYLIVQDKLTNTTHPTHPPLQICGLDSRKCENAMEAQVMFEEFISMIRAHPFLQESYILYCCERNTGYVSGMLDMLIRHVPRTFSLSQTTKARKDPGIFTDARIKSCYAASLMRELTRDSLCFMRNFLVCPQSGISMEEYRNKVLNEVFAQFRRAHRLEVTGKNDTKPHMAGWSGKVGDQRDDELLAVGIGSHVMDRVDLGEFGVHDLRKMAAGAA